MSVDLEVPKGAEWLARTEPYRSLLAGPVDDQLVALSLIRLLGPATLAELDNEARAKLDPTAPSADELRKGAPAPEPKGPDPETRATWERAALEAGCKEAALVDVLGRIQRELRQSVSLVDPTAEHASLGEFLEGLRAELPSYFEPEPKAGNGHDRSPDALTRRDPWDH